MLQGGLAETFTLDSQLDTTLYFIQIGDQHSAKGLVEDPHWELNLDFLHFIELSSP